jgi:tRNA(fMet)-specific endonuclease VapC
MAVIVDTDIVSFLYKRDTRAMLYRPHLDGQLPIISFMTLAELEQWTAVRNWGPRRRQELLNYLRRYKVEHSSPELCRRWAEVSDGARRAGTSRELPVIAFMGLPTNALQMQFRSKACGMQKQI